ncbi:fimbria/pilus periplasmic chaperone [Trabulsiella odontotermitis]|uniref:fimbrial biogenesis chaperone n=1 Tax=Trabulsiella odontotermitis TaxID=379893 RepID=UPI0024B862C1|nr:fimbria/pilus periplasmic chaperone [Trabulsiella odontotermitis]WHP31962.1 fimbria/pilus periplasmic chaperone [Trabulsiella odontotermitis]
MKPTDISKGMVLLLSATSLTHAAILPDRTRLILNQGDKSISLRLSNKSPTLPYLAQSWIEDQTGVKNRDYISTVPPLVRLEPGEQTQVRLMGLPALARLPSDRESLFYYNVREIPPRSEGQNVVQIAMQSRLKLFWRPKAIRLNSGQPLPWKSIKLSRTENGLHFMNSTPYHMTIGYVGIDGKTLLKGTTSLMLVPFSEQTLPVKDLPSQFQVGYIGDFGGLNLFKISCNAVQRECSSQPAQKD